MLTHYGAPLGLVLALLCCQANVGVCNYLALEIAGTIVSNVDLT